MTLKPPYILRTLEPTEVSKITENFSRLYASKLESRLKYDASSSASIPHVYQTMELGEANFSAAGSPTVARSFPLGAQHGLILYANAHAKSVLISAHVTDITQTSITIEARLISGTANFSAVTTASIPVYWQVIGSSP